MSELCPHGRIPSAYCEPCAEIKYKPMYASPSFADTPCKPCEALLNENKRLKAENARLITEKNRMLTAHEAVNRITTDMLDPVRRAGPNHRD